MKLLVAQAPAEDRDHLNLCAMTMEEMIQAASKRQDKLPRHMPVPTYTSLKPIPESERVSSEERKRQEDEKKEKSRIVNENLERMQEARRRKEMEAKEIVDAENYKKAER